MGALPWAPATSAPKTSGSPAGTHAGEFPVPPSRPPHQSAVIRTRAFSRHWFGR